MADKKVKKNKSLEVSLFESRKKINSLKWDLRSGKDVKIKDLREEKKNVARLLTKINMKRIERCQKLEK